MIVEVAAAAALVNGVGFCLYVRRIRSGEIEPNGVSWTMRAYGAAALFVIWSDVGVPWPLMLHSAVSGLAACAIAVHALARGGFMRPARQDYVLLACDVAMLGGYLMLTLSDAHLTMATTVLAITSARKLAPYWPILRTTYARPRRERPAAWIIWAAGYALLWLAATEADLAPIYQAYALAMVAVHLVLAQLSLGGGQRGERLGTPKADAERRPSEAAGGATADLRP